MSIRFVCGAECRVAVLGGLNPTVPLRRHWTTVTNTGGTPGISTSVVRSGAASYVFANNGSGDVRLSATHEASGTTVHYFRGYFRVDDITPSAATQVNNVGHSISGARLNITTGGVLQMSLDSLLVTQNYSGTFVADEWYGVEMQVDNRAVPATVDWRIWRQSTGWVNQTQVAWPGNNSTGETLTIGAYGAAVITVYWDDLVWGRGTTIDEDWSDSTPKGGEVTILRPNADGTHSFSASGDFKYENATSFAQSATDVYSHLDADDFTQTAEFISQNVTSSGVTKYCEVLFANESTLTGVHAVMPLVGVKASGTQACEMNIRLSDDGTNWTNLLGNWGATGTDVSETTNGYVVTNISFQPPSGGSWDQTKVNGLRMQFGMSDDISPVPYVMGLAFEVAWLEAVALVPYYNHMKQLLSQ